MNYWSETEEQMLERWRLERLRENAMLAFHDEIGGGMTGKALALKFDLRPGRVCKLLRERRESREREALHVKIERLEAGAHIAARAGTFTAIAERLWMDLGWLASSLENRPQA
jgi:hypothetical protein